MSKVFDAVAAQELVAQERRILLGRKFRHWKGNLYQIVGIDADEASGNLRVSYVSLDSGPKQGWCWSRTYDNFFSRVQTNEGDRARFVVDF